MTEVVYLPLKSAGGAILGHARIAGGLCSLRLKRAVHGQAVILGEDGTWFGGVQEEIGVRGRLCAVAVLEEGRLLCCGIPQGQKLGFSELQRQLERPAAPTGGTPVRQTPTPAAPKADLPKEAPQEVSAPQREEAPTDTTAKQQPSARPVRMGQRPIRRPTALQKPAHATPVVAEVFTPISAPAPAPEQPAEAIFPPPSDILAAADDLPLFDPIAAAEPIREAWADDPADTAADAAGGLLLFDGRDGLHEHTPSLADSAADSEAFAALLRRAELVFESIEAPHPPLIAGGKRSASRQRDDLRYAAARERVQTAAGTAAQRSWGQEVDLLLGERPAETKTAVENPFPHIFPNAVFFRIGGSGVQTHLEGDWLNGGERMRIYAVPGTYTPQPPAHLQGYTRFIRTPQGSFWVRVTGGI